MNRRPCLVKVGLLSLLLAFASSGLRAQGEVVFSDSLPDFRLEWAVRSGQLLQRYAPPVDSLAGEHLARAQQRLQRNDYIRLSHITRRLSPNAPGRLRQEEQARMDSLSQALRQGADFAELARRYSDDAPSAAQGGAEPWTRLTEYLQEWIDVVAALPRDSVSRPFVSPLGVHLVKWTDCRAGEPDGVLLERIAARAERRAPHAVPYHTDLDTLCRLYPAAEKELRALYQQMIEERLHPSKPDEATSPTLSKKELKRLEKERKKAEKERKKAEKERRKTEKERRKKDN